MDALCTRTVARNLILKKYILVVLDKRWCWLDFCANQSTGEAATLHFCYLLSYFTFVYFYTSITYERISIKRQLQLALDISCCFLRFGINRSWTGAAMLHILYLFQLFYLQTLYTDFNENSDYVSLWHEAAFFMLSETVLSWELL